jgi:deoxyhypusine synthase
LKGRKNDRRETPGRPEKPRNRPAPARPTAAKPTGAAHVTEVGGRGTRPATKYGSGFDDRLQPTVPVDLSRVRSVSDLVEMYGDAAIGARQVGEAANILEAMVRDPDCYVVCTVSGAMTVAKMGLVLCEMIESGMVQAVVSTGALMAHGFVEAAGLAHFKHDPAMSDEALFERGYNRVYDSVELEKNLDEIERIISSVLDDNQNVTTWSSAQLNQALGRWLSEKHTGRGILRSAFEHEVPVYVPAFTDSELGLDFALHNRRRDAQDLPRLGFDPFLDLDDYTERVDRQKRIGIFTIGGGVPRNWAQQVGPYLDILAARVGLGHGIARFHYGVRICPEPAHWGGLSGCTYSEGVSWGKFIPREEGGRFAEVYADATIVWPLVVQAVRERLRDTGTKRAKRGRGASTRKQGGGRRTSRASRARR